MTHIKACVLGSVIGLIVVVAVVALVNALVSCAPQIRVLPAPFAADYATPTDRVMYESSVRLLVICPNGEAQSGSGFAISRRHVITAHHVVACDEGAPLLITAILRSGVMLRMDIMAVDPLADAASLVSPIIKHPFANYAEVRLAPGVQVGEEVCSIGGDNPNIYGVKKCGFVSVVGSCMYRGWQPDPRKLPNWFHTSIPVVPGNSGSAVFDSAGKVVGIVNTWNGSFNREQGGGHYGVWAWWGLLPIREMLWSRL